MFGVCHELGEKFGIDPLIFQIGFVIWFLNTPIALLAYIVLALLI